MTPEWPPKWRPWAPQSHPKRMQKQHLVPKRPHWRPKGAPGHQNEPQSHRNHLPGTPNIEVFGAKKQSHLSVNESMNPWFNEPLNPWINESMDRWINESMNRWIHEYMNKWINESMNRRLNESMNRWINESLNQWSDEPGTVAGLPKAVGYIYIY